MKKTLAIAMMLTIFASAGIVLAQDDAELSKDAKRADIHKLMEVTGAGDLGVQVMEQMIASFKRNNAGIPDEFWDEFIAEVDPQELIDLCVPSYEKHFTHEEIKQLIAFYEMPLGKKLVEKQPAIMQECMVAGQQWGQELAEEIVRKLQAEGF